MKMNPKGANSESTTPEEKAIQDEVKRRAWQDLVISAISRSGKTHEQLGKEAGVAPSTFTFLKKGPNSYFLSSVRALRALDIKINEALATQGMQDEGSVLYPPRIQTLMREVAELPEEEQDFIVEVLERLLTNKCSSK